MFLLVPFGWKQQVIRFRSKLFLNNISWSRSEIEMQYTSFKADFLEWVYILCTLIALDALAKFSKRWPNKYLWMATVLVRTYTNFLLTFYWAFSTFEIKIFATLYHMKYSTQYTIGRELSQNIQNSFSWLWETCSDEGNKRLILR